MLRLRMNMLVVPLGLPGLFLASTVITMEFPSTPSVKMSPNTSSVMKLSVPIPNKSFCSSSSALLRFHGSSVSHTVSVRFMSAVFSPQICFKLWHTDLRQLRFPRLMRHAVARRSSDPRIPLRRPHVCSYSGNPTLYSYTAHECCGESTAHGSVPRPAVRTWCVCASNRRSSPRLLFASGSFLSHYKGGAGLCSSRQHKHTSFHAKPKRTEKETLTPRAAPGGRFLCRSFKTHLLGEIKMKRYDSRRLMVALSQLSTRFPVI